MLFIPLIDCMNRSCSTLFPEMVEGAGGIGSTRSNELTEIHRRHDSNTKRINERKIENQ